MSTVTSTNSATPLRTIEDLTSQQRTVNKELGQDQFMQLLVQQMANQDPLSPTSDTDFIAQLAQFSMLNQMTSMSDATVQSQMYSLVGKYVYVYGDSSQQSLVAGLVDGVVKENGTNYLVIGEQKYKLSDVVGVANVSETKPNANQNAINSTGLLGKNVTAAIKNEDGTTTEISGTVVKLSTKDGVAYATISNAETGDKEVAVSSIEEIYS
ncbi:MAG TPA: flagellar hook capping FlgD N-terminal domain-containing protein [Clostridia bacterium]|nr:flagellar hook capping FlgD N-terminal domain-containing protein [Clostridia bacterium]